MDFCSYKNKRNHCHLIMGKNLVLKEVLLPSLDIGKGAKKKLLASMDIASFKTITAIQKQEEKELRKEKAAQEG